MTAPPRGGLLTRLALTLLTALTAMTALLPTTASAAIGSVERVSPGHATPGAVTRGLPAEPAAPAAPAAPGDCKGDPPRPGSPYGHLAVRPVVTSTKDPFTDPNVSIESVYGTTYRWWAYDNGCAVGSGTLPGLGARLASLEAEIAGVVPSWGHYLMDSVVDPSSWIGALDPVVTSVTAAVSRSVWTPYLMVALTLVAILVMWRARAGQVAGSITAAVWALLVLVFVTWTLSYPSEAVAVVDEGVQATVVGVATAFTDAPAGDGVTAPGASRPGPSFLDPTASGYDRSAALASTDRLYDQLVRNSLYRTWLSGVFGNAESKTATTYGPEVFRATHFSFAEYDTYEKDPTGAGQQLLAAKSAAFTQVAAKVAAEDPVAYEHFTGNDWESTMAAATIDLVVVLACGLFLLVAGMCTLVAYVIVRLAVPVTPAAGILFLLDTFRAPAMALLTRIAAPVVMGPVFLVAGLLVLRFNAAIQAAQGLNAVLKLLLVLAVSILAHRLLKPGQVLLPRMSLPGLDLVQRQLLRRSERPVEEVVPAPAPRTPVHRDVPILSTAPRALGGTLVDPPLAGLAAAPVTRTSATFAPRPIAVVHDRGDETGPAIERIPAAYAADSGLRLDGRAPSTRVAETNEVLDADGRSVFIVYHPSGSSSLGPRPLARPVGAGTLS